MEQQHLLFDGDDTLWENNIYFERAIARFIDFLNHSSLSHEEVRAVLDEIEAVQGYGSANFAISLQETYKRLAEREIRPDDLERVRRLGADILGHPMQLVDGVEETLAYLAPRHDLVLITKGDVDEQRLKIEGSGLETVFRHVAIVPEKDVDTYRSITADLLLDARRAWMIGNSPRSDINPALAAGLNAVFIPHPDTWRLEHEEVRDLGDGRLLELRAFAELRERF